MRNPVVAISVPAMLAYSIAGKSPTMLVAAMAVAVVFYATRDIGTKTRLTIIVVAALAGALGTEIIAMIYRYTAHAGVVRSANPFLGALFDALRVIAVAWAAMYVDHLLRHIVRRRAGKG